VESDASKMRLGSVNTLVVLANFVEELGRHYLSSAVETGSMEIPAIAVGLGCNSAKLVTSVLETLIVFERENFLDERHINFETFFCLNPLIHTHNWSGEPPIIIIILKDSLTMHLLLTFILNPIVLRVHCVVLLG
jgi:hypothetical protein